MEFRRTEIAEAEREYAEALEEMHDALREQEEEALRWEEMMQAEYNFYDDELDIQNLTPEGMGSDDIDWESLDYE